MNIVIIEDETMSAEDLAEIILQVDRSIRILGIFASVKKAVDYLKTRPAIDLIFADVQLGDGLSFEIFREVKINAPIIFCTAFDEYAIEAFKTNAIEYILKPFDKGAIENALNKYHQLKQYFAPIDYNLLINKLTGSSRNEYSSILVYQKEKVLPVKIIDIAVCYIENEITRILCFDKKTYMVTQTLDELEKIGRTTFFRANRQSLVNRLAVTDAASYYNRKYAINLNVPHTEIIIVSKNRVADFLGWLVQE